MITETTVTQDGQRVVIRPEGDVVAASAPPLRSAIRDIVARGAREVIVDLTNVEMLDSTGIGLLISAHNSLKRSGGTLSVIHATPEILELLLAMRIHQPFSVSGD